MGSWVQGFMGSRIHWFVGSWVHEFEGSRVWPAPLLTVYSAMDACDGCCYHFFIDYYFLSNKVNKGSRDQGFDLHLCWLSIQQWMLWWMLLSLFHWLLLLVPTRSISPAPLLTIYSAMDAAMDAAITFSLNTTSCLHKVNKSCSSVDWLFCNGCCYHFFIDQHFLTPQGQ